jgi:hypothetical protein
MKEYSKVIKRRALWFEKVSKKSKMLSNVKENIDIFFDEDERPAAYAMASDMITCGYPFDMKDRSDEETSEIIKEKYGFDLIDAYALDNILDESSESDTESDTDNHVTKY